MNDCTRTAEHERLDIRGWAWKEMAGHEIRIQSKRGAGSGGCEVGVFWKIKRAEEEGI